MREAGCPADPRGTHLTLSAIQVIETRDSNGYMPSDHRPLLAVFHVN